MTALGHPSGPCAMLRAVLLLGRWHRRSCAGLSWGRKVGAAPCQQRAEVGGSLASGGIKEGSLIVAGVTCPLEGAPIQLKTAASPAERKELLAQGHCSSRIPFFPF